jgi:hypothetical protein
LRAYVVTEGEAEAALIRQVLRSADVDDVYVAPAGGRSAAMSLAKTIVMKRDRPVALVLDAETSDPDRVREQQQIVQDIIAVGPTVAPLRVFLAVPEVEAVFFADLPTTNRLLGQPQLKKKPVEAEARPKAALQKLLGTHHKPKELADFFGTVDQEAARALAQHEPFRSLVSFLRAPESDATSTSRH